MSTAPAFNLKNPCPATMKHAVKLSKEGSPKDTRHFEIDLRGSGMTFEPGDSLAVLPTNCPDLVQDVLNTQGWMGDESVEDLGKKPVSLREALISSCNLATPDKKFLHAIVQKTGNAPELAKLLEPERKEQLEAHLHGRELIDFLHDHPDAKFEPQEFVSLCKKLLIRLYSISSSLKANPDSVHLTVATVRYHTFGRDRKGVASTFLAERVKLNETIIPTFIKEGKGFRLPAADDATPVIFCGPGTGIAPFRSFWRRMFMENVPSYKFTGLAWLFMGVANSDAKLYDDELSEVLATYPDQFRLDYALSREQSNAKGGKMYIQDKVEEYADEVFDLLNNGAHIYFCGLKGMMPGIQEMLERVSKEKGLVWEEFFAKLKKNEQWHVEVY